MLAVLVALIGAVAVGAWTIAVVSLVNVILLVPRGQRLSALFSSGFWQFDKIRALGGPRVDPHLRRFGYAFAAFFFAVVGGILVGMLLTIEAHEAENALDIAGTAGRALAPATGVA